MTQPSPVPVTFDAAFYDEGPRPHTQLDFIVIHSVEGPLDQPGLAVSLAAYYFGSDQAHETSAHAIVDAWSIVEMVHPDVIAAQCGNCNQRGYGIEQSGYAAYSRGQWTDSTGMRQMSNVAWWAARIARAYNIPPRWLSDEQLATPGVKGFCTHNDVTRVLGGTTHTDPGPDYPRDLLIARIAAQLGGQPTPAPTPPLTGGPLDMAVVIHSTDPGHTRAAAYIRSDGTRTGPMASETWTAVNHLAKAGGAVVCDITHVDYDAFPLHIGGTTS